MDTLNTFISVIPVFVFLAALILIDTYKLTGIEKILTAIFAGVVSALISMGINRFFLANGSMEFTAYSRYISPGIEEVLKAAFIWYLIRTYRIGFMVDGAVLGFAAGAGFAAIENIYYLSYLENSNVFLWMLRGFGTAVMHGGTTAIFAVISKMWFDKKASGSFVYIPGIVLAAGIHSMFNHFLLPPHIITILQLILLPLFIMVIYNMSEKILRDWMEEGLDGDVRMLEFITSGNFSETKTGAYLHSLKSGFRNLIIGDMFCYLRIHMELSIRAKGLLLMREHGFPVIFDDELTEKLAELEFLEKSIGKTGVMSLSPILHRSSHDIWQLSILKSIKETSESRAASG